MARGIVPADAALSRRVVEIGRLIEDLCGVGEDEEAVSEAFRNPEQLELSVASEGLEVEASPFAEVRRVFPQIHSDIPDVAGEDADQFALRFTELVMKSAEHPLCGKRLIVLDIMGGETGGGVGLGVVDLGKPAAFITEAAGLDQFDVPQGGLKDLHEASLSKFRSHSAPHTPFP